MEAVQPLLDALAGRRSARETLPSGAGDVAPGLGKKCLAEGVGTFLLVLFGCGVVHASVLTGAQSGLWQVAIVWGVAIMLAFKDFGSLDTPPVKSEQE